MTRGGRISSVFLLISIRAEFGYSDLVLAVHQNTGRVAASKRLQRGNATLVTNTTGVMKEITPQPADQRVYSKKLRWRALHADHLSTMEHRITPM
jgi:hypothetical protein